MYNVETLKRITPYGIVSPTGLNFLLKNNIIRWNDEKVDYVILSIPNIETVFCRMHGFDGIKKYTYGHKCSRAIGDMAIQDLHHELNMSDSKTYAEVVELFATGKKNYDLYRVGVISRLKAVPKENKESKFYM